MRKKGYSILVVVIVIVCVVFFVIRKHYHTQAEINLANFFVFACVSSLPENIASIRIESNGKLPDKPDYHYLTELTFDDIGMINSVNMQEQSNEGPDYTLSIKRQDKTWQLTDKTVIKLGDKILGQWNGSETFIRDKKGRIISSAGKFAIVTDRYSHDLNFNTRYYYDGNHLIKIKRDGAKLERTEYYHYDQQDRLMAIDSNREQSQISWDDQNRWRATKVVYDGNDATYETSTCQNWNARGDCTRIEVVNNNKDKQEKTIRVLTYQYR